MRASREIHGPAAVRAGRPTPQEIGRAHHKRATEPALRTVAKIVGPLEEVFRGVVRARARAWRLDEDDLFQRSVERVLRANTVDPDAPSLVGWLTTCVRYAAHDLLDQRGASTVPLESTDFPSPPEPDERNVLLDCRALAVELFDGKVSPLQLEALLLLLECPEMDLRTLARGLRISYQSVRQVKSRMGRTARALIGLTDDEVAAHLGKPCDGVDASARSASAKIRAFLHQGAGGTG